MPPPLQNPPPGPAERPTRALLRWLRRLLAPHRGAVAVGLVCVPAAALATLAVPVLTGRAVDTALALAADPSASATHLLVLCGLALLAGVAEAGLRYVARRRLIDASRLIEERLKNDLVRHLVRVPVGWFDRARSGDLISRLTQDVELLRFVAGPALLHGGAALVVIPGGIWLMASLSWQVCLAASVAFLVLLGGLALLLPRLQRSSEAVQETIGALSQRCSEACYGIHVVLTFGRARAEAAAMRELADVYLEYGVDLARARAGINTVIHLSRELVVVAVLVVGVSQAIADRLTVGELFQFLMLTSVIVWPLMATSWIVAVVFRSFAAAQRIDELLAVAPEPPGGQDAGAGGALEVRGLRFAYPGQPTPVLDGVSFALAPGHTLGVVGGVGSGKSTLLALLTRLHEPPPGCVFWGGVDVLQLDRGSLRQRFAYAEQEPFLFDGSLRDNVTFAAPSDTTPDAVAAAVHASALEQDLALLPRGLDTIVGERGVTLSGGQKQRVSLARALAAERAVLLLDDTLSAVDHATEARILARLDAAPLARTAIVVSHRLSAVEHADEILLLDQGRVVERGDHDSLLRRGGRYAALHALQRRGDTDLLEEDA